MGFKTWTTALLLGAAGCGVVNGNGYRELSTAQKAVLRPFSPAILDTTVSPQPVLFEVELTGRQLAPLLRSRPYTWVYLWVPYCRDTACRPLWYYDRQEQRHRADGLSLLLVSQIYDPVVLHQNTTRWGFNRPVYVPAAGAYGYGMYRARDRFVGELVPDSVARQRPAHLLFRHDTLLYAGADLLPAQLDALIGR